MKNTVLIMNNELEQTCFQCLPQYILWLL